MRLSKWGKKATFHWFWTVWGWPSHAGYVIIKTPHWVSQAHCKKGHLLMNCSLWRNIGSSCEPRKIWKEIPPELVLIDHSFMRISCIVEKTEYCQLSSEHIGSDVRRRRNYYRLCLRGIPIYFILLFRAWFKWENLKNSSLSDCLNSLQFALLVRCNWSWKF